MTARFPSNLHMHTLYADGENTAEEMILAAIQKGFVSAGISEHAYTPYDTSYCMPPEKTHTYRDEIYALARKYAGQIEIYAGLEVDCFYLHDKAGWDYTVGSVHYAQSGKTGRYYALDYTPGVFELAVEDAGGGDIRVLFEKYCADLAGLALGYRPDILGHIDIMAKLNRGNKYFDPEAGWYLDLWEKTAGQIAASGCIVELNTGAMSRGYTDEPYPRRNILRMLHAAGVPLTLSSDAHNAKDIDYAFDKCFTLLREIGCRAVKMLRGGKFVDYMIMI